MKIFFTLLMLPFMGQSQCRYFDRIFSTVNKTSNIIYGNAPAITSFYLGESFTTAQDLKLDVIQPDNDTETKRALILFAHSGGFINGSKDHADMQALCDTFAHYGYVTASMDYRLNFNLLSSSSSERAVWRGIQDASSAVRFFKQNATVYNIDTNKIIVWGSSAGAFLALGLAYVDDMERPASTFSSPNLGCKDCTGNNFTATSKIAGIVSCWGATKDTSWIQNNNNVPVLLFHGTNDGTVPFNEGYPFGLPTITYVRGSQQLNAQLNRTNIYHEFYPAAAQDHEYWGTSNGTFVPTGPTIFWSDIINKSKSFIAARIGAIPVCAPLPVGILSFTGRINKGEVNLDWNTSAEFSVHSMILERSIDGREFGYFTSIAPKGSVGSGAAYNIIDRYPFSGTSFYRLKIIDIDGSVTYSQTVKIQLPAKGFNITQLYPNPVKDVLQVQMQSEKMQAVQLAVYDMNGRMVIADHMKLVKGINNTTLKFFTVLAGMYAVRFTDNSGNTIGNVSVLKK